MGGGTEGGDATSSSNVAGGNDARGAQLDGRDARLADVADTADDEVVVERVDGEIRAGGVVEGPEGPMAVVETADDAGVGLALSAGALRSEGLGAPEHVADVVAGQWERLDAEPTVIGGEGADAGDVPDAWAEFADGRRRPHVLGKNYDDYGDDHAGFEAYRDAVEQRLAAEGLRPDADDAGEPSERVATYLDAPRAETARQYESGDDRRGGLSGVSLNVDDPEEVAAGASRVTTGTVPETGDRVYLKERAAESDLMEREEATYAFLDAAGARVPRHEFDTDPSALMGDDIDGELAEMLQANAPDARSVSREVSGVTVSDLDTSRDGTPESDRAERLLSGVSRAQATDQVSANLIAGNWDIEQFNAILTDGEGAKGGRPTTSGDDEVAHLVVHDVDRGATRIDDDLSTGVRNARSTLNTIGVDADNAEVRANTRRMAREMVESGDLRRLTDAVAEVDPERAKAITHNVALFALGDDE